MIGDYFLSYPLVLDDRSQHRRTGQHPFGGGADRGPSFARMDLVGGVAENFRDPYSVGGVVAEIFRDPYSVGWHNCFR